MKLVSRWCSLFPQRTDFKQLTHRKFYSFVGLKVECVSCAEARALQMLVFTQGSHRVNIPEKVIGNLHCSCSSFAKRVLNEIFIKLRMLYFLTFVNNTHVLLGCHVQFKPEYCRVHVVFSSHTQTSTKTLFHRALSAHQKLWLILLRLAASFPREIWLRWQLLPVNDVYSKVVTPFHPVDVPL